MKILIPMTGKGPGGAFVAGAVMAEALIKAGYEVTVCLPTGAESVSYFTERGVPLVSYSLSSDLWLRRYRGFSRLHHKWLSFRFKSKLKKWVRQMQPDILHFNDVSSAVLAGDVSSLNVPSIVHVRDFRRGRKQWIAWHDAFIYVSNAVREESHRGHESTVESVVYDPPDPRRFIEGRHSRDLVRQAKGIPAEEKVIGFVGALVDRKRPSWLVEAVARLRSEGVYVSVYFLGKDTHGNGMQARLERRSQGLGVDDAVHFMGFQSDVSAWMIAFDILVSCGKRYGEAYGLTLLEAGLLGVPTVGTHGTGAIEVLPKSCLSSEADDFDGFVDNLKRLVLDIDERHRRGELAQFEVLRLSENRLAADIQSVYRQVLKESTL